eukprot:GILI01006306.1.p1 GENE.GILI01006306.1~~GILI01006306.1.p1  ORF type:complete len:1210 (+),score=283.26 GILI01006306.1:95-3631(+)
MRSAAERYRGWSAPSPSVVLAVCTPQAIKELHSAILRLLELLPTNTTPKSVDINHHSYLYGAMEAPPSSRVATIRRMILMMNKKMVALSDEAKAIKDKEDSHQLALVAAARNRPQSATRGRTASGYDYSATPHTSATAPSPSANYGYGAGHPHYNSQPYQNDSSHVHRNSQQLAVVSPHRSSQQLETISPHRARPQSASAARSTYSAMSMTTLHTDEHIRRVAAPGPTDLSVFSHNASYYVYTDTTALTSANAKARSKSPQQGGQLVAINGSSYTASAGVSPMAFRHRIAITSSDMADKGTMVTPRDTPEASEAPPNLASRERTPDNNIISKDREGSNSRFTRIEDHISPDELWHRTPLTPAQLEAAEYPRKEARLLDEEAEGRAVIAAIQDSLRERVRKLMERDGERIRVYEYVEYGVPLQDNRKKLPEHQYAPLPPMPQPEPVPEVQADVVKTNPPSRRTSDVRLNDRHSISPIRARHQQKEAAEAALSALLSDELDGRMMVTGEERRARLVETSYVQLSWEEGDERHRIVAVLEPQYREDIRFKMHYAGMDLFPEERALTTAAYLEQYQIECEEGVDRRELQGAIRRFIKEELQGERAAGAASAIQLKFREHLILSGRGNISSKSNSPYRHHHHHGDHNGPSVDLVYVYADEEEARKYKHHQRSAPSSDTHRHSDSFINEVERQRLTGDRGTTPNVGGSKVGDRAFVLERSNDSSSSPPLVAETTPRPTRHEDPVKPLTPRRYSDEERRVAATKIQCQVRCHLARHEFQRRVLERSILVRSQQRSEAATRIQCQVRSHQARKEMARRRFERKPSELTISSSVAGTPYRPHPSSTHAKGNSEQALKLSPRSEHSGITYGATTPKQQNGTQPLQAPLSRTSSNMSKKSVATVSSSTTGMRGLSHDVVAHAVRAAEETRFVGGAPSIEASFRDSARGPAPQPTSTSPVQQHAASKAESPSMSSKRSSIMAATAAANGLSTSTVTVSGSGGHGGNAEQLRPSSTTSGRPQSSSHSEGRSTVIRNTRIAAIWEFLETLERIKGDEADTRAVLEEDEVFGRYLCVCHWPRPFPIPLIEHAQPQDYNLLSKEEAHHYTAIVEKERTALTLIIQRAAEFEVRHGSSPGHDTAAVRPSRPSSARLMDALRRSSSGNSNSKVGGETPTQQVADPLAPRGMHHSGY